MNYNQMLRFIYGNYLDKIKLIQRPEMKYKCLLRDIEDFDR